jgi:maltose/moltooligosaccharide transporter
LIPSIFYKGLIKRNIKAIEENRNLSLFFGQNVEIVNAVFDMPPVMWKLSLVYLFQWYALFVYWQNAAKSIAQSVWKTSPTGYETV